ncbi:MAG: hypothetical protein H7145_01695 [Akkermansiaceae bacterium]|nr:hypothetical protein [Armatimonadota bacterium]
MRISGLLVASTRVAGSENGDTREIFRFNVVKDKSGAVVYREETKVGIAQVQDVQANGAKIKITTTEVGQKIEAGDTVRVRRNLPA